MNEIAEHVFSQPFIREAARDTSFRPAFELEDVSYKVGQKTLLHPLSIELPPDRVVGLIGHNGSGKSTLIKMLAGQQAPSEGQIIFEGTPLSRWRCRALARRLAYLPQSTGPASAMLVKELVAMGRYPWHGALGRFRPADRNKVEEAMVLTGTNIFADRLVETLSGGERQRVWLAMLIAQDAKYLLLDEPISALDIAHQIDVLSLVKSLSRNNGLGVVVVLHDVNMAARYCDEIIALHSGRLIARGAAQEIMTPTNLEAIYGVAMEVIKLPSTGTPIGFAR